MIDDKAADMFVEMDMAPSIGTKKAPIGEAKSETGSTGTTASNKE